MTRIAVVDNSSSAAERMLSFLQRYQQQHNIIFQISFFPDGAKLMENYRPIYDIIFLDIEMPGKDGMTTAREIREIDQDVILVFVTRMAQYAVDGYQVRALDYLVKPINYSAFEMRMNLLLERLPSREEKSILVSTKDGVRKVKTSRLIYVEVNKHKLIYHTEDGDFETSDSMKRVEEELSGQFFERCDNSFLVNLRHVTWVGQKELVAGGCQLKLARTRRKTFLQALTNCIGGQQE